MIDPRGWPGLAGLHDVFCAFFVRMEDVEKFLQVTIHGLAAFLVQIRDISNQGLQRCLLFEIGGKQGVPIGLRVAETQVVALADIIDRQAWRRPGVMCIDEPGHVKVIGRRHMSSVRLPHEDDVPLPDYGPVGIADHELEQGMHVG